MFREAGCEPAFGQLEMQAGMVPADNNLVSHPRGAKLLVAEQAQQCTQAREAIVITGVKKVIVAVDDLQSSLEFWTQRVGFQATRDETFGDERWIELATPDGRLVMVLSPRKGEPRREVPEQLPHSDLFFNCKDIEATYQELKARGVHFPAPPTQMHFGWWSLFEDQEVTRYSLGQWD